ncbi:MAG: hypothetical protein J6D20_05260 [Clostridia bacterium]|nr:hypothetical protein [Clostridia bacterium]
MEIYRICFCGHRKIYGYNDLEDKLEEIAINAMREHYYVDFYVGRNGDFDISAASAVKRAQKRYGNHNSSLILVQPYPMSDDNDYKSFYDEIIYPVEKGVHFKQAITMRNRWMIENSDLFICFVSDENNGDATKALKYATKIGAEIINMADFHFDNEEEAEICFGDDRYHNEDEKRYSINKIKALLYIRAHYEELTKIAKIKKAYNIMLDEIIRENSLYSDNKILTQVTEEARDDQNTGLDFLIKTEEYKNIERYKNHAAFAVRYIKNYYK